MRGLGTVSLVLLVLSWLALDDITTDSANAFPLEYMLLVLAGAWFAALGMWLFARRRRFVGAASLAAVALGVVAFWSLPHHYQPGSLVNMLGYVTLAWFVGVTIWLFAAPRRDAA